MNILLSEAKVPINIMAELSNINQDFEKTDLVLIVGCNDTVNPAAYKEGSPIFGMAVCDVWKAKKVVVMKRKRGGVGFAGIDNEMFDYPNTGMFLGELHPRFQELLALLENPYNAEEVKIAIESGKKEEKKVAHESPSVKAITAEELARYKIIKTIGVPKEIANGEKRVAIIPKVVIKLRKLGFGVKVETKAGELAGFTDEDYEKSGAEVVSTEKVWNESEIIIKIREPLMHPTLKIHEAEMAKGREIMISAFDPAIHPDTKDILLKHAGLSVWSMKNVPRITRAQKLDTMSSTGKLDGYRAVIEAFNHFRGFAGPQFTAAGKIDPARVFVIGCGVIGLAAIGTASGLGAKVEAFDARQQGRTEGESIGAEIVIDEDLKMDEGAGTGGYAKAMGEEYYNKQKAFFKRVLKDCDIVISTARVPGMKKLILITEETVKSMKRGSVIMDVSGMNCELTK
jgi:NAD/NADP transhydrogenase alpha subunit